jgi:transposase
MRITKDFLNLISDFGDDWKIEDIEVNVVDKTAHIHMKFIGEKLFDPETEQEVTLYDHSPKRSWRHLDIWDYKTYIVTRIPRVLCVDGKVKKIAVGWTSNSDRHTYSFEIKVINTLIATKNQTKTAELLNCSFKLVNRVMHKSVERGMSNRETHEYSFNHLSIDEKSFKKNHKYVTILSDPIMGCVLNVAEGRNYATTKCMLEELMSPEQMQNVQTISMDMWKAYIKVAKLLLPEAEVVHDRFHLVKYLNDAIDKIRRREIKDNEVLNNSRYAILKNEENRTQKQQEVFEAVIAANLEVSKAYHAKESFKSLFDIHNDYKLSLDNLKAWASKFFMYKITELNKVILRMLNHSKGVVNAMISNWTNAMAERLNGKVQEIKVSGRGYRTFDKFKSAILFFHGKLNLFPFKWA